MSSRATLQQQRLKIQQQRKDALQSDDPNAGEIILETQRQLAEIDKQLADNAWQANAKKLAEHAVRQLLNRNDGMGAYGSDGAYTFKLHQDISEARTEEIQRRLVSHFKGRTIGGIHANSAKTDGGKWFARFGCIDLDLKPDHPYKEARRQRNHEYALNLQRKLAALGIQSIVEDSNGSGAYHIWFWLTEPIEVARMYAFLQSLVSDAELHGFERQFQRVDADGNGLLLPSGEPNYGSDLPETFPKQDYPTGKGFGNWIRPPGKHHTYDHWSRVWGEDEWLSIEESVDAWLSLPTSDVSLIPELPEVDEDQSESIGPAKATVHVEANDHERIGDLAERTIESESWSTILQGAGWKLVSSNGAESKWTRPGKDGGVSAKLNFGGNNLLTVFTTAVSGLNQNGKQNESYGKWRFYCWSNGFENRQVEAAKAYLPASVVEEHERKSREEWKAKQEASQPSVNLTGVLSSSELTKEVDEVWIVFNAVDEADLQAVGAFVVRAPASGKESFTDWSTLSWRRVHIIDGGNPSSAANVFSLVSHYAKESTVEIHPLLTKGEFDSKTLTQWFSENCLEGDKLQALRDIAFPRSDYGTEAVEKIEISQGLRQKPRSSFAGICASELSSWATQEADWLVHEVFTIDEPLLVGARSKGCKTLQLTDLAVAVATGTKWFNVFDVPKRRKVLFITGEANYRRIAKHIEKACSVRGIEFPDLKGFLRVEAVEFPCLPSEDDQAAIRADVKQHGFEVVIVDPLYRGLAGVDSSRLSQMGSAIKSFQAACHPAMMILSHHVVKSAAREYGEPPTLEDMTGAGIAESCGQWWLVGRNEKYQWDWKHDLCIQFGGREGQGGGRRVLFNEHDWTFHVDGWHEYAEQAQTEQQQRRDDARRDAQERKRATARALILKAMRNEKTPQSKNQIELNSGAVQADFRVVFAEMLREQSIVQRPYRDSMNRLQSGGFLLSDYVAEYEQSEMFVSPR